MNVVTRQCDGIFRNHYANLLWSLQVKEFRKLVII